MKMRDEFIIIFQCTDPNNESMLQQRLFHHIFNVFDIDMFTLKHSTSFQLLLLSE